MRMSVLSPEDRTKHVLIENCLIDHYYANGIVYEVASGHGIFGAWQPFKEVGKFLSVYRCNEVHIDGLFVEVNESDMFCRNNKKISSFHEYCKLLEKKRIKLPVDPLSEADEREYISDLIRMFVSRDRLECDTKLVLEKRLAAIALNEK